MIIRLTNASQEHRDKPILLNTKHILSVFETTNYIDTKTIETATNIYMVTQQSWLVKEPMDKVEEMINGCNKTKD